VKFIWTKSCEEAFKELKRRLTTSPILLHPDTQKHLLLNATQVTLQLVQFYHKKMMKESFILLHIILEV